MVNKPLISIIFPIFNSEKYLKESLESILNQTYKNFEIIALDDGSTDRSFEILQSYDDDRIRIYRTEVNKGLVYQLNKGIQESRGEYIARMDSDDISRIDRLEKQLLYLTENLDLSLCGSYILTFTEEVENIWSAPIEHEDIWATKLFCNSIYHPTVFAKKEIFENLYDQNFKHAEDYELWTRLISKGFRVGNIPEPLLKYRLHGNQIGSVHRIHQKQVADQIRLRQISLLIEDGPEGLRYLNLLQSQENLDKITFIELEKWIKAIFKVNSEKNIFSHESLSRAICVRLLKCLKNSEFSLRDACFLILHAHQYSLFSLKENLKIIYILIRSSFHFFLKRKPW